MPNHDGRTFSFYTRLCKTFLFTLLAPTFFLSTFLHSSNQIHAQSAANPNTVQYTFEGLIANRNPSANNSWTTGNVCQGNNGCYAEGGEVSIKIEMSGLEANTTYSIVVQAEYSNAAGDFGYTGLNNLTPILEDIGATSVVVIPLGNVACQPTGYTCQNYQITFTTTSSSVTLYMDAVLSEDVTDWNGASLNIGLLSGVSGTLNGGRRDIQINPADLLELPSLTIIKEIESGTALPSEWCFNIAPSIGGQSVFCITGDGDGVDRIVLENLSEGSYTINEVAVDNYEFISGEGTNCTFTGETATGILAEGDPSTNATCIFHNGFEDSEEDSPQLLITKVNNRVGQELSAGEDVLYTLEVTAEGDVYDVKVTDLIPQGITYRSGTWTAMSSVRGNIKKYLPDDVVLLLNTTAEPAYDEMGVWDLGNMIDGEIVTLTYWADISDDIEPGVYHDMAWAQGLSALTNGVEVLANIDSGVFVGTEVNIVFAAAGGEVVVVLQNATLPATGAQWIWSVVALMMLAVGALMANEKFSKVASQFKSYSLKAFIILALIGVFVGYNPTEILAETNVAIELKQPISPSNRSSLNLSFVAMDVKGRSVSVQCFKKGPSDSGMTQFQTVNLANGGGTGSCNVTPAIINIVGEYTFRAVATAGDETSGNKDVVYVFDSTGPSPLVEYEKTVLNPCTNKITFKTANDNGETNKVEIYRSQATSFTANSNTRITTITIGSDQFGQHADTVPNCGEKYYYALRAVDLAGNASAFTGDTVVNVTAPVANNPSPANSTTNTSNANNVQNSDDPDEGDILGSSTESENDDDGKADNSLVDSVEDDKFAAVQGVSDVTDANNSDSKNSLSKVSIVVGIGLLGVAAAFGYTIFKKSPL